MQSDASIPLIPPPPAPLNIPPSRARRQLAARLALHKQQAEAATTAAEEEEAVRNSDDPFARLGDHDDGDASDPFTLDEEEEDITASGRRDKKPQASSSASHGFSVSRGLTSLFSPSPRGGHDGPGDEDERMSRTPSPPDDEEDDQNSSGSENGHDGHPLEAATSQERIPLETDEDEDEEMGEMVAPSEEAEDDVEEEDNSNSSDDQEGGEVLSPVEREKLRGSFGSSGSKDISRPIPLGKLGRQPQRDEEEDDDDDDEGEGLVEIAMPSSSARRMT